MDENKTDIVVRQINERLKNDFKAAVAKEGLSMTHVLRKMIKEYTYDRKSVDNR